RTRAVYLPEGSDWYCFWTEKRLSGSQRVEAEARLDSIPVFIRAGAIIPLAAYGMEHTDEVADVPFVVHVYMGADARFVLYEDEGDGYEYEQGAFALMEMEWSETARELG